MPQDPQYLTAREVVKAQLVFNHMQRETRCYWNTRRPHAAAEFRAALDLDPENEFARERLEEATREMTPTPAALHWALPATTMESSEIHLEPNDGRATFHYSGDVRGLFASWPRPTESRCSLTIRCRAAQVRFNVDDVDFFAALKLACRVSKTCGRRSTPIRC